MEVKVQGRYPSKTSRMNQNKMVVATFVSQQAATIRVDDDDNLDFWLEISFSKQQLKQLLEEMENCEE